MILISFKYVPTSTRSDDDIEKFYEYMERAKAQWRQQAPPITMVDFNAKVGGGKEEHVVGFHKHHKQVR